MVLLLNANYKERTKRTGACVLGFLITLSTHWVCLWWKIPEFSVESLCLRQGMVTSGRWCHMTLLDQMTPVRGCQVGCPSRCPCSVQAWLGGFRWPPWFSSWTHCLPCPIFSIFTMDGLSPSLNIDRCVQVFNTPGYFFIHFSSLLP